MAWLTITNTFMKDIMFLIYWVHSYERKVCTTDEVLPTSWMLPKYGEYLYAWLITCITSADMEGSSSILSLQDPFPRTLKTSRISKIARKISKNDMSRWIEWVAGVLTGIAVFIWWHKTMKSDFPEHLCFHIFLIIRVRPQSLSRITPSIM